jgi:hypothetical protein
VDIAGHVNFQDVRGEGLTTGNGYRVPYMHLTALLILISAFSVQGSATETTAFQLISEGPAQSAPDLLVHAQFLFTINANVKSL